MNLGLSGKKAIVTGATRGIGRAIAETLADEGVDVAICARNADQVNETVIALKKKGIKAVGKAVDVSDGPSLTAWIAEAARALGGIDILVSNPSAIARQNRDEAWRGNFNTDLMGAVHAIEAAKPFLEKAAAKKGDAAIVIIASAAAAEADEANAYGAIKAALIHFAKGVARQHAHQHIRANVVSPGTIYFDDGYWGRIKRDEPDRYDAFLKRNPMGSMGTLQEVANTVVFLASPASSFTTGINLIVDGAFTARVNF